MTKSESNVYSISRSASTSATATRPELNWPELAVSSRHIRQNGWEYRPVPKELSKLPENIQIPEKLQQILIWSLIRGSNWSFERPETSSAISQPSSKLGSSEEQNNSSAQATNAKKESQPPSADNVPASSDTPNKTILSQPDPKFRGQSPDGEKSLKSRLLSKIRPNRPDDRGPATISKEAVTAIECTSCFDELPESEMTRLKSCQHWYCKDCLSTLITTAMSTEASFPPKCCLSPIPLKQILKALSGEQREQYQEKAAEYAVPTSDRWYCPNKECLKWIPRNRLKLNKDLGYDCPHCSSKLCRTCRGDAHPVNTECPQDFGLEATLETAEIEGWQRCYKCRALVEHNKGCRHMTCRCGGQFCYVCGVRWPTCNCTETDAANKRAGVKRRRDERTAKLDAEAAEIARAIAEIEEMERREAEEQRLEEERKRKQENELLLRLEAERQEEERRKEAEAEQAERDFRKVLVTSFEEDWSTLEEIYYKIVAFQSAELTSRHQLEDQKLGTMKVKDDESAKAGFDKFTQILNKNSSKRRKRLQERHAADQVALDVKQEEEEDDLFLQVQMRLRGKANKESRMERMLSEIHKQQEEEKIELEKKQQAENEKLDTTIKSDIEGVQRWYDNQLHDAKCKQAIALQKFGYAVGADRQYFEIVVERRNKMLAQHCSRSIFSIEQGDEPTGLREYDASKIEPSLPELDEGQPEPSGISRGPIVINTPHGPLTMTNHFYQKNNSQVSHYQPPTSSVSNSEVDDLYASGQQTPTPSRNQYRPPIPGAFPTDASPFGEHPIPPAPLAQQFPPPLLTATLTSVPNQPAMLPSELTISTTSTSTPTSTTSLHTPTSSETYPSPRAHHPNPPQPLIPQPLNPNSQPTATMATLAASVALALRTQPVQRQQEGQLSPNGSVTIDTEHRIPQVPPMATGMIKRNRWKFKRGKEVTDEEVRRRTRTAVGDAFTGGFDW